MNRLLVAMSVLAPIWLYSSCRDKAEFVNRRLPPESLQLDLPESLALTRSANRAGHFQTTTFLRFDLHTPDHLRVGLGALTITATPSQDQACQGLAFAGFDLPNKVISNTMPAYVEAVLKFTVNQDAHDRACQMNISVKTAYPLSDGRQKELTTEKTLVVTTPSAPAPLQWDRLPKSFVSCAKENDDWSYCHLVDDRTVDGTMFPENRLFIVSYTLTCNTGDAYAIALEAGNAGARAMLATGENREVTVVGPGPLVLTDVAPESFSAAFQNGLCGLFIQNVKTTNP